jgi:ArsR family transcriptional regulator, arsenate/arsenite/antimonite-responsive transcriptional repressor
MSGETADQAEVLRALAHPVRWGILQRLAAEPGICACDFTEFFDVSQPTISAHLKVLREAGLVTSRRVGTTICYSIDPGPLAGLADQLARMAATAPQSQAHSHQRGAPTPS